MMMSDARLRILDEIIKRIKNFIKITVPVSNLLINRRNFSVQCWKINLFFEIFFI